MEVGGCDGLFVQNQKFGECHDKIKWLINFAKTKVYSPLFLLFIYYLF